MTAIAWAMPGDAAQDIDGQRQWWQRDQGRQRQIAAKQHGQCTANHKQGIDSIAVNDAIGDGKMASAGGAAVLQADIRSAGAVLVRVIFRSAIASRRHGQHKQGTAQQDDRARDAEQ